MGLRVDALTERQVIDAVVAALAGGRGGWIVNPNVDVLRQLHASAELRALVAPASLQVADGTPLLWAAAVQGTPLPERVAGSSLIYPLTKAAAEHGLGVFLLGGNPGTAERAGARLIELAPGLRIAGTYCPPMGFERDPAEVAAIEAALEAARPDIVFVALGFPKQERLTARLRERFPSAWFVGSGITLSFVIGEVHRAPDGLQRLGLEWVHRLWQEPRRLFRRYVIDDIPFAAALFASALRVRLSARARGRAPR